MNEPSITINGHTLTEGQAMAVRVAITNFHAEVSNHPNGLGADEHGRAMTAAYRDRLFEVLRIMIPRA